MSYLCTDWKTTSRPCLACKAEILFEAIRKCHACGYEHCLYCQTVDGDTYALCPRCKSNDVFRFVTDPESESASS